MIDDKWGLILRNGSNLRDKTGLPKTKSTLLKDRDVYISTLSHYRMQRPNFLASSLLSLGKIVSRKCHISKNTLSINQTS